MCKLLLLSFVILLIEKVHMQYLQTRYEWLNPSDISASSISLRIPRYVIDISDKKNDNPNMFFKLTGAKSDLPGIQRKRDSVIVYPEEVTSCTSQNYTENLRQVRKNVSCRLRERVVELEASGGAFVYPNIIVLQQCEGLCNAGRQCLPNGATEVEFYVQKFQYQYPVCSLIKVLQPTSCSCGCPDKNTCPRSHRMNSACKCICRNRKEVQSCMEKDNTEWDERTCICTCRNKRLCTTGTFFSENTCRCEKLQ